MIYFIQAEDGGHIKIGTTIRLSARLKQLCNDHGTGLRVLAVTDGTFDTEKTLHQRFAHLRVVNEWFEPGDDLIGFIVADGKPWDGTDEAPPLGYGIASVKMNTEVVEECRIAAAHKGMTLAEYLSESMRIVSARDIDEALAKRTAKRQPPKSKGKGE